MAENNNQDNVRQYLENVRQELYDQRKTIRKRFLDLHNRMPSKEEEALYLKRKLGGEDSRLLEQPLQESHPEDYLPIGAALKLGATGVAGGAALLSMMLRKGPTTAKGVARRQAGFIGTEDSILSPAEQARKEMSERLFAANIPQERIFKETGWFELVPGERRFLDLDFVDDLAGEGLVKRVPGTQVGVIQEGSLGKHISQDKKEFISGVTERQAKLLGKHPRWRGTHNRATETIEVKDELLDDDTLGSISHELQHRIQWRQGKAGGISLKQVMKDYDLDEDTAFSVYRHALGEVEARATQYYHVRAKELLKAGNSPEQVKKTLRRIHPIKLIQQKERKFRPEKIWTDIRTVNTQEYAMDSIEDVASGITKSTRKRASHNRQDRLVPKTFGEQQTMENMLKEHDYSYFLKKDGSVSVDIYDSEGGVKRETAKNIKELRNILGY